MKTLAQNKRATFDYELLEKSEAGLVLLGHEVKSIKTGRASLKSSFVTSGKGELFLTNAHIPFYSLAGQPKDYDPERPRKLLLHKKEIDRLMGRKQAQGLTLVPISLYNRKGMIKLLFAIGRGKRKIDKRQTLKKREDDRKMQRAMKGRR